MQQASDGYRAYMGPFATGLLPDPVLWVDEWSDEHMVIPASTGAAEPGKYRSARTPYARAVMRALSPEHPARNVVVKGASQLLKTQMGLNWFCSLIACAPSNMLWLQPTESLAKRVSSRFDKTVAAVPAVADLVAQKRSRDNRNTIDTKEFPGGTLLILTARSASNLAEATVRYAYVDEVDRILRELKGEGDPLALVDKRQATHGDRAKTYYSSSPTEEGASRIDELFQQGNQQFVYVPCPHCGEKQVLEWERMEYDLQKKRAWYVCLNGCEIDESLKGEMIARGEWIATAAGDGETESFAISFLYAPPGWDSWVKLAAEYEKAKYEHSRGDSEKMQVFFNTRLARCWTVVSGKIEPEELKKRAERYPLGIVPAAALMVTASSDIQINRIEVQIVGWGPGQTGLEPWFIGVHKIFGDPALPDPWNELDALLKTPIAHASGGAMIIRACLIDSGDGNTTQEVYEFTRARKRRFVHGQLQSVIAVKGASQSKRPVLAGRPSKVEYNYRGRPVIGGAEVWMIGTDTAKDWLHNRLALEDKIAIHTSDELPLEFYEQLLAETRVSRWVNRRKQSRYEPIRRGISNEQSDMAVYNLAAAHYLGLQSYTAERWEQLRASIMQIDIFAEPSAPAPKRKARTKKDGGGIPHSDGWAL